MKGFMISALMLILSACANNAIHQANSSHAIMTAYGPMAPPAPVEIKIVDTEKTNDHVDDQVLVNVLTAMVELIQVTDCLADRDALVKVDKR